VLLAEAFLELAMEYLDNKPASVLLLLAIALLLLEVGPSVVDLGLGLGRMGPDHRILNLMFHFFGGSLIRLKRRLAFLPALPHGVLRRYQVGFPSR
jgi:hypothetical protein